MTLRTVELPTNPAGTWDNFAWASKAAADDLPSVLDATRWLASVGLTLLLVTVQASPGLIVSAPSYDAACTLITLAIAGGTPGTTAWVKLRLFLSGGGELNVTVAQPVRVDPAADALLTRVADPALDAILTLDGDPVTFGSVLIPI